MNDELAKATEHGLALAAYPYPGGFNYYVIPWREINSRLKLSDWKRHLEDKRWFTKEMAAALIKTAAGHFNWSEDELWWML